MDDDDDNDRWLSRGSHSSEVDDGDDNDGSLFSGSDSLVPSHSSSSLVKEVSKACDPSSLTEGQTSSSSSSNTSFSICEDTSLSSRDLNYPKRIRIHTDPLAIRPDDRVDEWIQRWFHDDANQHENSVVQLNEQEATNISDNNDDVQEAQSDQDVNNTNLATDHVTETSVEEGNQLI